MLLPYHGLVVCSYGHVDDLCRALLVMATHPAAVGEIFNVTPLTRQPGTKETRWTLICSD